MRRDDIARILTKRPPSGSTLSSYRYVFFLHFCVVSCLQVSSNDSPGIVSIRPIHSKQDLSSVFWGRRLGLPFSKICSDLPHGGQVIQTWTIPTVPTNSKIVLLTPVTPTHTASGQTPTRTNDPRREDNRRARSVPHGERRSSTQTAPCFTSSGPPPHNPRTDPPQYRTFDQRTIGTGNWDRGTSSGGFHHTAGFPRDEGTRRAYFRK